MRPSDLPISDDSKSEPFPPWLSEPLTNIGEVLLSLLLGAHRVLALSKIDTPNIVHRLSIYPPSRCAGGVVMQCVCIVMGAGLSVAVRGSYSQPLESGLRRIGLVKTLFPTMI